jgi:hypothetical protein
MAYDVFAKFKKSMEIKFTQEFGDGKSQSPGCGSHELGKEEHQQESQIPKKKPEQEKNIMSQDILWKFKKSMEVNFAEEYHKHS